ncbi:antichymotrypsin-2-like isoform X2 [Galleria mellonella]|uniref:Antichymotrypsin-2-like isoform X2 n=1 Tax=Galleria mellonella TaxID=7137 RepID=A0ABM3MIB2_GALME|nr:antichymotrypsin-2-like isoform X2 [Galleria mellonella]
MLKIIFLIAITVNVLILVSSTYTCGENEEYEDCPDTVCRAKRCSDLGFPLSCPDVLPDGCCPGQSGCICKFGYVRNCDGVCIPSKNCPSCGGDENAVSGCGINCNKHCSDIGDEPKACIQLCYPNGCDCKKGYYLDDNTGKCVLPSQCSDDEDALLQGSIDFTGNFLYEVIKTYPLTSVVMSPVSVLIPLAELALYTNPGDSYNQLMNTLNLTTKNEIRSVFPVLISSLKSQKEAILDLAAKIYVNEQYQLTDNFENDSRDVFEAEAENIDFSKPEQAADTINAWVEKETRDRIKNLVSPDIFSADTRLVLTNVIYFLGNWQNQFNPNDTKNNDFHVNNDITIQVPMMYKKGNFKYAESKDLDSKILEIPYKGGNFSYVVFLPNNVEGYNAVAEKLRDPDVFNTALDLLKYEPCFLYIPKHEITTSIDLADILKKLKVTDIFDINKSDLSGILKSQEKLGVSAALQKANIKVDETGTEAAAANAIVGTTAGVPSITYTFKADHSFLFYLLINRNPLFCGAYAGEGLK